MRQKSNSNDLSSEEIVKGIRRATRKRYSAEEKIRIVLDGLRGEMSIAELCRREAHLLVRIEEVRPGMAVGATNGSHLPYSAMPLVCYALDAKSNWPARVLHHDAHDNRTPRTDCGCGGAFLNFGRTRPGQYELAERPEDEHSKITGPGN